MARVSAYSAPDGTLHRQIPMYRKYILHRLINTKCYVVMMEIVDGFFVEK